MKQLHNNQSVSRNWTQTKSSFSIQSKDAFIATKPLLKASSKLPAKHLKDQNNDFVLGYN